MATIPQKTTKIIIKSSNTAGAVPQASDLDTGEIAFNLADKKIFSKDSGGQVIEIAPDLSTIENDIQTLKTKIATLESEVNKLTKTR